MDFYALRNAAKDGADMGPHEGTLRANGSQLAASALTFFYALRSRHAEIDQLLKSTDRRTRWGVVRALSESFHASHTDRLAFALLDPDTQIQGQAFDGLEDARKAGHSIEPSTDILARLQAQTREDIVELVYLWTTTDPLCRICMNLDDHEISGTHEGMPKEKRELIAEIDGVLRCPQCDTRYHYDWHEQYEDDFGQSHGTWQLRRLPPPRGVRTKDVLRTGLSHPLRRRQRECARELAVDAIQARDTEALRELLTWPRRLVRFFTAGLLPEGDALITELLPTLRTLIHDPDDDVRSAAAEKLTSELVRTNDIGGLQAMLAVDDRWVRWHALRGIEHAPEIDRAPFRATLEAFITHADDFVRDPAKRILGSPR